MKTFDEALESIAESPNKTRAQLFEEFKKSTGIIDEIKANPRTHAFILDSLKVIGNHQGVVDPYSAAFVSFIQGILIGMMMEKQDDLKK